MQWLQERAARFVWLELGDPLVPDYMQMLYIVSVAPFLPPLYGILAGSAPCTMAAELITTRRQVAQYHSILETSCTFIDMVPWNGM